MNTNEKQRKKIKIGFLGYGTRALDYLMQHDLYEVKYFLAPRSGLCQAVYDAQENYREHLSMEIIDNKQQLAERFAQIKDVDCFLMNACPIILNKEVLSYMQVFNIHPGDLHMNRGHQPHCWTVLLGEKQTKITLHTVTEKIDLGSVIQSIPIEVSPDDNATEVLNHAEDKIPLLLDALYEYLTGQRGYESVIEEGGYRHIMTYEDYEIHLEIDTKEQIKRKILARSMYHGAFILYGDKRVYVDRMISYSEHKKRQGGTIVVQIDVQKETVSVHSVWRSMLFHLNKTESVCVS